MDATWISIGKKAQKRIVNFFVVLAPLFEIFRIKTEK